MKHVAYRTGMARGARERLIEAAERLFAQPKHTVEHLYVQLEFPVSPEFGRMLTAEQQRAKKHVPSGNYSLEEFGLNSEEIRSRLADLFARYGWDTGSAPRPSIAGGK